MCKCVKKRDFEWVVDLQKAPAIPRVYRTLSTFPPSEGSFILPCYTYSE